MSGRERIGIGGRFMQEYALARFVQQSRIEIKNLDENRRVKKVFTINFFIKIISVVTLRFFH